MADHFDAFERRAQRGAPRGATAVWDAAADQTVPTYVDASGDERGPVPALSVGAIAAAVAILGALVLGGDPTSTGGDAVLSGEVDPALEPTPSDVRLECGSIEKITFDDGTAPAAAPSAEEAVADFAATDPRLAGHEGTVGPRDLGELLRSSDGAPGVHIGLTTSTSAVVAIGGDAVGLIDVADVGGVGYSVTMARLCHERLDGSLMAADSPSGDVLPSEGDPGVANGAATLGDGTHLGIVHSIEPLGSGYAIGWEPAEWVEDDDGTYSRSLQLGRLVVFVDSRVQPVAIRCAATCVPQSVDWEVVLADHGGGTDAWSGYPAEVVVQDGVVTRFDQVYAP